MDSPSTEYVLLGALFSGPRHGYEIRRILSGALGDTWHVGTSQIYALLKRLERESLVRSRVYPQKTRPSRRVFEITASGKETFLQWLYSPSRHVRDLRLEFLAKLYFFGHFPLKGGRKLFSKQVQVLEDIREGLLRRKEREEDPFAQTVSGFRLSAVNASLEWLRQDVSAYLNAMEKHSDIPIQ